MDPLATALLAALAAGQVTLRYGRIEGCAGWLNRHTRVVTINPDATPEQLVAELLHDLADLVEQRAPIPPRLRLLDGGGLIADPTQLAAE